MSIKSGKSSSFGSKASTEPSKSISSSAKSKLKIPEVHGSVTSINTTLESEPSMRLITKDLIRTLQVPRTGPPHFTAILTPQKLASLKEASRVVTKSEKEAAIENLIKENDKLREASEKRKTRLQDLDVVRKQNEKLNDLEQEAKEKTEYLRKKANDTRLEAEEEIREINELILCAKVQAIRDSQVVEKQLIKRELNQAEADVDAMMEKRRVEGLKQEDEKARQRKKEAYESAALLKIQIKENEESRIINQEKKDREGTEMLKQAQSLQFEDFQKMKEHKFKQRILLESLIKENEVIAKRKEYEKEHSQQEDRWIAEYQKQKAAKEEAAEAEIKEKKKRRELEIAKLRKQQERAKDIQAEKDALRARRAQEEKERKWRQNEKERMIKHQAVQEDLKKARNDQINMQDKLRILKANKDHEEFQQLVVKNKYEMKLEELQKTSKKMENLKYADEVREQIKEKEKERIQERKDFFKEGVFLEQEQKRRAERLDCVRRKKLEKMREYDISETYLRHIERKTQLPLEPS